MTMMVEVSGGRWEIFLSFLEDEKTPGTFFFYSPTRLKLWRVLRQ